MKSIFYEELTDITSRNGINLAAVSNDISPLLDSLTSLKNWQKSGCAADLAYMQRDPQLFVSLQTVFKEVQSVISFAIPYETTSLTKEECGYGRVARYAWGKDYHKVIKKSINFIMSELQKKVGDFKYRFVSDAVPLLERALALRSGLGCIGQNGMLINPSVGSFFFLAEVMLDVKIERCPEISTTESNHCIQCSKCLKKCPTGALIKPFIIDARRCISYLTIEKRGMLSIKERESIGNHIFGCDECQEICPYNIKVLNGVDKIRVLPELTAQAGSGEWLKLSDVLAIRTHEEFVNKFAGTAIMRGKREGLLRNAAVVAANTASFDVFNALLTAVKEDESDIVKAHALWAAAKLALDMDSVCKNDVKDLVYLYRNEENSPTLREEAIQLEALL